MYIQSYNGGHDRRNSHVKRCDVVVVVAVAIATDPMADKST